MSGSTQESELCIKNTKWRASDILFFFNSEAGEKERVDVLVWKFMAILSLFESQTITCQCAKPSGKKQTKFKKNW